MITSILILLGVGLYMGFACFVGRFIKFGMGSDDTENTPKSSER